jgi:RNA ligase
MCRGLITDLEGNIVSRPFAKFFNFDELTFIPTSKPVQSVKFDGSLGILYFDGDTPQIATRGSFTSDQAIHASSFISKRYTRQSFLQGKTYLWEIIYPENRIVCDYGDTDILILIAVIDNETGREDITLTAKEAIRLNLHEHCFANKNSFNNIDSLRESITNNMEGFVIYWPDENIRAKIKGDEYIRLHRILTDFSSLNIWDLLRNNQTFDEVLEKVPDEFFDWVIKTRDDLISKYNGIEEVARVLLENVLYNKTRKEIALYLKEHNYDNVLMSVIFAMLDNKKYDHIIWKSIRPAFQKPFLNE